jgi:hypothetical protein
MLFGLLLQGSAPAQIISSYTFQRQVVPYNDLPGPGLVMKEWSGGQALLGLGNRTFKFFGHEVNFSDPKNLIGLLGSGELIVMKDTLQFSFPGFLASLRSRDETSSISHGIYSYLDDSVYVVQWKNAGFVNGESTDYVNFQIWLYMESGVIEYRYGARHIVGDSAFDGSSGPSIGLVISDPGISTWYSSIFVTNDPVSPTVETDAFFTPLTGTPASGTVYRFTPAAVASVPSADKLVEGLRAYPNPVQDMLVIEPGNEPWGDDATAVVHDMLGRTLGTYQLGSGGSTLDLRSLPSGAYMIEVRSATQRRTIRINRQ